jgi:hypothetical protein
LAGNCPAPFIESPLIANDRAPFLLVLRYQGDEIIQHFLYFILARKFPAKIKEGKENENIKKR